jgi:hypothetical protein
MSPITLTVRDETTTGETLAALEVQFTAEQVTVRELIRARVHQEVREHNAKAATGRARFFGLVQPSDTERDLNGYRMRNPRRVNPDKQTEIALAGFERGQILLLVDDRQVDELDHSVTLKQGSTVTFLKLVPLVGG